MTIYGHLRPDSWNDLRRKTCLWHNPRTKPYSWNEIDHKVRVDYDRILRQLPRCLTKTFQLPWLPGQVGYLAVTTTTSKGVEGVSSWFIPERSNDASEHIWKYTYHRLPKEVPALCWLTACALSLDNKVTVNLCFYASRSLQSVVGDLGRLREKKTLRVVNSVSQAIVQGSDLFLYDAASTGAFFWSDSVDEHCYFSIMKGAISLVKIQFLSIFFALLYTR